LPYDVDDDFIKKFNPKGVILSGGPDTVTLNDSARAPQIVFDLGVPILYRYWQLVEIRLAIY
jgi:GMP synthase (glutamine-hydrolysing)